MNLKPGTSILSLQTHRQLTNPWIWGALLAALVIALPLLVVFSNVLTPGDETWLHILRNLIPTYVLNTLLLMAGVSLFTFIMGVSTAWLVSMYSFPGRKFFSWALIMPIALPAYISGFTWAGILDYTSPVYVFLRNNFGIDTGQYLFFNILSLPGAIIILSLALYPYVFLISRAYFSRQSSTLFEVAASLGKKQSHIFFGVALPMARPAIVAGISLALMEVLNDYGLARYFGVDTFTTGIFTAWFAFSHPQSALKLSAYLMIFVLILIILERTQRGKMRYDMLGSTYRPIKRTMLKKSRGILAMILCMFPFLMGFLIPVIMLIYWSNLTLVNVVDYRFTELLLNSFVLAAIASAVVTAFALFIAFTVRSFPSRFVKFLARVSTLGYAIPGAVVAIGILIPFLWMDSKLITLSSPGVRIALTGTWFALIFAYLVRFMAVGFNSIDSGMERISPSLDEASRSLGLSNMKTLGKINMPLLRGALISAALLVFIDVLKELPLTLILRPFNFDTLAIRAFEFASDERVAEAAPAAMIIIITGMVPVLLLNRLMGRTD
ncbi:MAG: iron ABC transporter permease [Bacteroidales bacterium]|nr:iron ABC transporter permease [Bacteroidales bacterium]